MVDAEKRNRAIGFGILGATGIGMILFGLLAKAKHGSPITPGPSPQPVIVTPKQAEEVLIDIIQPSPDPGMPAWRDALWEDVLEDVRKYNLAKWSDNVARRMNEALYYYVKLVGRSIGGAEVFIWLKTSYVSPRAIGWSGFQLGNWLCVQAGLPPRWDWVPTPQWPELEGYNLE